MKKKQIRVGGVYLSKINGRMIKVRVEAIREVSKLIGFSKVFYFSVYDVVNLSTESKMTFRTAAKFHSEFLSNTC